MNNPFATVPTPAQPMQANPFATQAPVQHQPSFPTSAPTANPFAAVVQAPPPAPPTQGVAAIQAAFAFPPLNPPGEAGLGLQPVAVAPAAQVQVAVPDAPPEPAPKARRSRKPKADAAPVTAANAFEVLTESTDEAECTTSDPRNPTRGYSLDEQLAFATTEELRDALNARGWNVTLVAS